MNYTSVQLHDFVQRFDALTQTIETARDKAEFDQISDIEVLGLSGIESQIDTLCSDIKSAPAEVAKDTQMLMAQMITRLDELAAAIQTLKTEAEEKLVKTENQG